MIAWNVFEHFFPYWDDASKSPGEILHNALVKAGSDKNSADIFYTLKLMCAALNDGHMFYNPPNFPGTSEVSSAPIVFTKAEGRVLVKFALDSALQKSIHEGDIVDSIENTEALTYLNTKEQYMPGSAQCKERDALTYLANGAPHTALNLTIEHDGAKKKLSIPRNRDGVSYIEGLFSLNPTADGEIKKGIYYFNLSSDSITTKMERQMSDLLKAKAIILDMRCYQKVDLMPIIEHLMTAPENAKWMHTPLIIYPDHKKMTYMDMGWNLNPIQPHISAKIYLLTDASAMSAAESVSGYFKDLKLATIIGQPTAGSNGNIVFFNEPGQSDMYFSGMLVTNHDGSKHHLIGIVPDIFVNPTIKGIREGRDEILERAITEAGK